MVSEKAVEICVKRLLDEMLILDGPHGDGGGLIKRSANPWMTLSAQLTRNYIIYHWLIRTAVHPDDIVDGDIKNAYVELYSSLWAVSNKTPVLLRALGKLADGKHPPGRKPIEKPRILGGFRILSWYEDPDYWECAVLFSAALAAFATGHVLEGIGLAVGASNECRDFLENYEKGDDHNPDKERDNDPDPGKGNGEEDRTP